MVEHFELNKDFWIARWLKKPSKSEIENSKRDIVKNNRVITIGLSDSIIEKIITLYKNELKKSNVYGAKSIDISKISHALELPKPLVVLVLERKKIIIKEIFKHRNNELQFQEE